MIYMDLWGKIVNFVKNSIQSICPNKFILAFVFPEKPPGQERA